jgi:CRISPR-associated protein Cas1
MEQGLTLAVDGGLYSVERNGHVVQQVRVGDIDEVLVFGSITVTPAALAGLMRRGTDTVFLTARGQYRGRLVGKPGRNVELRIAQFERLREPALAIGLARSIVAGKVANQRYVLLRAQREQKRDDLAAAIALLRRVLRTVETAPGVEALRGLEGQASAAYFGVFGRCIRNPRFLFEGRSRRPPRDAVNAMLSFGYTMLGTAVESAILRAGMDPMLGVFHSSDYGRPSLALDLIEEFRPIVVDSLVLRLVNRREVVPEDFEAPLDDVEAVWEEDELPSSARSGARGVWLGDSGRRVFFRAWGRRLRETHYYEGRNQTLTLEDILHQQVYRLARVLRDEEPLYRPFRLR